MEEDGEAVWVGGGSFKVDREKALEKLSAFRLAGEHRFLEAWMRAAVANEATRVDLRLRPDGLTMEFDGRGFKADDLKEPYGVLFEKEKEKTEDRRYLALGILSLLPDKPGAVDVFYGAPGQRLRTTVSRLDAETTVPVDGEERNTLLRVVSLERPQRLRSAAGKLPGICAMSPARIFIDGVEIPRYPRRAEEPGAWVEEPGFRAWIGLPEDGSPGSFVELSVDGVRLDWIRMDDHDARVIAHVDASGLSMNADHSKPVLNDRFRALSNRIQNAAPALAALAAGRLKKAFDGDPWNVRARLWLRDLAARRLTNPETDADDALNRELWDCPLYRRAEAPPASLRELLTREHEDGSIRCVMEGRESGAKKGTVICRERGEFNELIARFAVRD